MGLILRQPEIQAILNSQASCDTADLSLLAEKAWLWRVQFQVQKAHLIAQANCSTPDPIEIFKIAENTLFIARLMERLYESLGEANLTVEYNQDVITLQKLLNKPCNEAKKAAFAMPELVQKITYHADTTRLLALHTRRIGLAVLAFPSIFGDQCYLEWFLAPLAPIFTLMGFLIYLPRTIFSLFLLIKYAAQQQTLPLKSRFFAHAEIGNRLFNIINDFPTVAAGFVAVFILTSSTLFLAPYITVAVKFCEVVFAAAKAYVDISRLHALREQYIKLHDENPTKESRAHLATLEAYIKRTATEQYLMCTHHTLILFCLTAFIPALMLSTPLVPIFAAVFAIVLVCLRIPSVRSPLLPDAVECNLAQLSKQGFFAEQIKANDPTAIETMDCEKTDNTSQLNECAEPVFTT